MKALVRCHHKNIFAALSSRHIKSEMVSSLSKKKKNTLNNGKKRGNLNFPN